MKMFILAVLALILVARNAQAFAPAPTKVVTNECGEIEIIRDETLSVRAVMASRSFVPHEKTPEQKFWAIVNYIDGLDPHRSFRIVLLVLLAFLCDEIRLRRRLKKQIN